MAKAGVGGFVHPRLLSLFVTLKIMNCMLQSVPEDASLRATDIEISL
jgi:hypothetical protein